MLPLLDFGIRTRNTASFVALILLTMVTRVLPGAPARPTVAVVLSGGSAFGIAHIGVIEAIEAAGIPIDMVLGTSMGSIVAGLYASGYSPQEMDTLVSAMDWGRLFVEKRAYLGDRTELALRQSHTMRIGLDGGGKVADAGMLHGQNILAKFTELTLHMLPYSSFDDFPVRYRAVAMDIFTGESVVFDRGSIAEAMRASMSIPGLFQPYTWNDRVLTDGGTVNNMPVDVARTLGADIVIAVESRAPDPGAEEITSFADVIAQTFNLLVLENMRANRTEADLLIRSDLAGFTTADYTRAAQIVERGREAGRRALPQLQAVAAGIARSRNLVLPEEQPNRSAWALEPRLTGLRIVGGSDQDRSEVAIALNPFIDRPYSRSDLRQAIDRLNETGRFDFVKLHLSATETAPGGATATITLVPTRFSANAAFLDFDYTGVYGAAFASDVTLAGALLLRDRLGPRSILIASASVVQRLSASLEYIQPVWRLWVAPWARFVYEYDTVARGATIAGTAFQSAGGGAWLGAPVGSRADLALGYSLEATQIESVRGDLAVRTVRNAGLRAFARHDNRRTTIMPDQGSAAVIYGRWFDPRFGGELDLIPVDLWVGMAMPLSGRDTVNITLFGATDFSFLPAGPAPTPPAFQHSLRQPGLFYGLPEHEIVGGTAGNSTVAAALEYRRWLGVLHPLLGGDLYAVGNGSIGTAFDTPRGDTPRGDEPPTTELRWCVSVGFGARITTQFGALVTVNLLNADLRPDRVQANLTIQIGSFAARAEHRR